MKVEAMETYRWDVNGKYQDKRKVKQREMQEFRGTEK